MITLLFAFTLLIIIRFEFLERSLRDFRHTFGIEEYRALPHYPVMFLKLWVWDIFKFVKY